MSSPELGSYRPRDKSLSPSVTTVNRPGVAFCWILVVSRDWPGCSPDLGHQHLMKGKEFGVRVGRLTAKL